MLFQMSNSLCAVPPMPNMPDKFIHQFAPKTALITVRQFEQSSEDSHRPGYQGGMGYYYK